MIRLFNDVWLSHRLSMRGAEIDVTDLLGNNCEIFWQTLLFRETKTTIFCSEEEFVKIFKDFFSNILKDNSKENLINLFDLYCLELSLKKEKNNLAQYRDLFQTSYTKIYCLAELSIDNLGYEFLLPNFLLTGNGKNTLLAYVKFCCWSLLSQELEMYATDMKRDIFNAHHVAGKDINIANSQLLDIPTVILNDSTWNFILKYDFDHKDADVETALRTLFPNYKEMIDIFNNHAVAHRDAAGVDSYLEPVSLIYRGQYEELLYRDLGNNCRITYVSDSLGENTVCTFVSKVYWAYKNSVDPKTIYRMFEIR